MTRQAFEITLDAVCAALRKPLSDGGGMGMTAALKFCSASEVAEVVTALTNTEALAVFEWLDDIRASAMLTELPPSMAAYIVEHAPPGRIVHMNIEEDDHKIGL